MNCRTCYAELGRGGDGRRCPKCMTTFDAKDPATYLARPFPSVGTIAFQVAATTLLAVMAAWMVAAHQALASSGH